MSQDTAQAQRDRKMLWLDEAPSVPPRKSTLLMMLGPVVYFIRTEDGLVKIGHTGNLETRRHHYGPRSQILAWRSGTREDEQAIHAAMKAHLARGLEWYHPTPEIMALVQQAKDELIAQAQTA